MIWKYEEVTPSYYGRDRQRDEMIEEWMFTLQSQKDMAHIPQSLYKAMKRHSSGLSGQII
jgi:hypothetical protein